jgi:hypothetical protein
VSGREPGASETFPFYKKKKCTEVFFTRVLNFSESTVIRLILGVKTEFYLQV